MSTLIRVGERLFPFLLEVALKVTALAVIVLGLALVLGRKRLLARYWLGVYCLIGMLILPLTSFIAGSRRVSLLPAEWHTGVVGAEAPSPRAKPDASGRSLPPEAETIPAEADRQAGFHLAERGKTEATLVALMDVDAPAAPSASEAPMKEHAVSPEGLSPDVHQPDPALAAGNPSDVAAAEMDTTPLSSTQGQTHEDSQNLSLALPWRGLIGVMWAAGCALMLLRLLASALSVSRMSRGTSRVTDPDLLELFARARRTAGVTRKTILRTGGNVPSPVAIGVFRPTILLPESLHRNMPPQHLRPILIHELAHVQLGDYAVNILQRVAESLLFFHPLVWFISLRLRHLREDICDNWVLERYSEGTIYAKALMELAGQAMRLRRRRYGAMGSYSHYARIRSRIERILSSAKRPAMVFRFKTAVILLCISAAIVGSLSFASLSARGVEGRGVADEEKSPAAVIAEGEELTKVPFMKTTGQYARYELPALPVLLMNDGRAMVPAQRIWSSTGVNLEEGQIVSVSAAGQVRGCNQPPTSWAFGPWGPEGTLCGEPEDADKKACALIGKIEGEGDQKEFYIGRDLSFKAPLAGTFYLGVADLFHMENEAAFIADVKIDGKPVDFKSLAASKEAAQAGNADAAPGASETGNPSLDAEKLPGKLVFVGTYNHSSRGNPYCTSKQWIKQDNEGALTLLTTLREDTYLARGDKENRVVEYTIRVRDDSYRLDMSIQGTKVLYKQKMPGEEEKTFELSVPEGALFDPNTRPDPYCATVILLKHLDLKKGESKEITAYDRDNSGIGMGTYTFRIENRGKEEVEVPAGTFEASHIVLTQLTTGDTWYKKRAGHVTDFWLLDNGAFVKIVRHREPYEVQLAEYASRSPLSELKKPPAAAAKVKIEAPAFDLSELPGALVFEGTYKHGSGGRPYGISKQWLKQSEDGAITAVTEHGDTRYIAFGSKDNRLMKYKLMPTGVGGAETVLAFEPTKVTVTERSPGKPDKVSEIPIPEGYLFDPNTRPDPYCAANILLRRFALKQGETKEVNAYDWDNSGTGMATYTFRIENKGKEHVAVPAGEFEANHVILTQLTTGDTWYKKRAGHVTDFWVLDDGVIVKILRHREPYQVELQLVRVADALFWLQQPPAGPVPAPTRPPSRLRVTVPKQPVQVGPVPDYEVPDRIQSKGGIRYVVRDAAFRDSQPLYTDRTYTLVSVPEKYQGLTYIQTANNDKVLHDEFELAFEVNVPVKVYVAYDDRLETRPPWLETFEDTGDDFISSDTWKPVYSIYAKRFPKGEVNLGPNCGVMYSSMYLVILEELPEGKEAEEVVATRPETKAIPATGVTAPQQAPQGYARGINGVAFMETLPQYKRRELPPAPLLVMDDGRAIVPAQRIWSDTGVDVAEGQTIMFSADGQVRGCHAPIGDWAMGPWGPEGTLAPGTPYQGNRVCALIGKIESGSEVGEFYIGKELTLKAPSSGRLYLGVSDIFHLDNEGAFVVDVKVEGKQVDFRKVQFAKPALGVKEEAERAPAAPKFGERAVVAADGSGDTTSIQEAIDGVDEHGVISVKPGTYREHLLIAKAVSIEGAGRHATRVETTGDQPGINIQRCKDTGIKGLTITCGTSLGEQSGLVLMEVQDAAVSVEECNLLWAQFGITISGDSNARIDKCLVAAIWGTGIAIAQDASATVTNCEVRNCYHRCITVRSKGEVRIENNLISGSAWHGIRYDHCSPMIVANILNNHARFGIYASGSGEAQIINNLLLRNDMSGVSTWFRTNPLIKNNTFARNERGGLEMDVLSQPVVENNIFFGEKTAAVRFVTSSSQQYEDSSPAPEFSHNLLWQNEQESSEVSFSDTVLRVDPLFVDAASDDYNLRADSPARGAGKDGADIGANLTISAKPQYPITPEEKLIIPDGDSRDFNLWKKGVVTRPSGEKIGVEGPMPRSAAGAPAEIIIDVAKDGKLVVAKADRTVEEINDLLAGIAREQPETRIVVRVHREAPYTMLLALLETCQKANISNVSLAVTTLEPERDKSEPSPQGPPGEVKAEQYSPPDFEGYFPDDIEGGRKLDAMGEDGVFQSSLPDDELLGIVRNGLRRTRQRWILRALGNRYIWGKYPQNPRAIEIMYHATDGPDFYNAIYFGLSVVVDKSPSILRRLVEICMREDDPNVLHRIAWGTKSQTGEILAYLAPYLNSGDEKTQEKARIVEKILTGELKAFAWAAEEAKVRAEAFRDKLPEIKEKLLNGDSATRREALNYVATTGLTLIMDDLFIEAWKACGTDPDWKIRNEVARTFGNHWIWGAPEQQPEAIELMLQLSRDDVREVRYNSVYFGLSTVRDKSEEVVRRLLEIAVEDREWNMFHRIQWGLSGSKSAAANILEDYMDQQETNPKLASAAFNIYRDIVGKPPPHPERFQE